MYCIPFFNIRLGSAVSVVIVLLIASGCASEPSKPKSKPMMLPHAVGTLSEKAKQEQRQAILKVRNRTLSQLYKLKPTTKAEIEQAAGYGVFEINGLNAVLVQSHGRGMVMERNGRVTYMQLARIDIGPNATLKPYWQVMVFRNPQQLSQFATAGSPANVSSDPNITLYQLTERGVSTQADWGARYFRDPNIN